MRWSSLVFFLPALALAQNAGDRYIVELAEPCVAETLAASSKHQRAALAVGDLRPLAAAARDRQRQAIVALEARGARVLEAAQTIANAVFVMTDENTARALATAPGVKRVRRASRYDLHLDRATLRHGAPAAWERMGGLDRAGEGVRVAVIDTGIDPSHPVFQDRTLEMPDGFPRVNRPSDLPFTSNKVIVARSYDNMYGVASPTAADLRGHGTQVAACVAAMPWSGPFGLVRGMAPKAYLGSYKVFPGTSGSAFGDVILKAFDDAVTDGMKVINFSLGSVLALRPEDDLFGDAFRRAAAMGVIVTSSAGNSGPDPFTMGNKSVLADAIGVGAVMNDRIFAGSASVEGLTPRLAVPGNASENADDLTGPMFDIERLDPTGLGCGAYPANALRGFVAFIKRGTCFFEDKINNAAAAGAIGALIYTDEARPDPITMGVGSATLPAAMVSYADGIAIKERLKAAPAAVVTIRFRPGPFPRDGNRVASLSSRGPNTDFGIKPDLVAVGDAVYMAAPGGSYRVSSGTSFSAPLTAGAAAALLSYRPGLSVLQYRSLIINSAEKLVLAGGDPAPVQAQGAGVLNLDRILRASLAVFPVSLSFGAGGGNINASKALWVNTLSDAGEEVLVTVEPFGPPNVVTVSSPAPPPYLPNLWFLRLAFATIAPNAVRVAPGGFSPLEVRFRGSDLAPGEYQGYIRLQSSRTGETVQVPYWYAVPTATPAYVTILDSTTSGAPGATLREAFYVRITDSTGVPVPGVRPTVSVASGGGAVLRIDSQDALFPGIFSVDVRLGLLPGNNVFTVQAGGITKEVVITGGL